MAKYMIHAVPKRMWYVNEYLIPSMRAQGIPDEDIILWLDDKQMGNLYSFMNSMKVCGEREEDGIWHLQDDVIICRRFKELTEEYDSGIVCGSCIFESGDMTVTGRARKIDMWYSFPCIRIPNHIAKNCAKWFFTFASKNTQFTKYVSANMYDDTMFYIYLLDYEPSIKYVYHLVPNLVDHIDWLIGGTSLTKTDKYQYRTYFFEDKDLIKDLEKSLKK